MKLLIHAINGIGLGHVIRTLRVAAALAECRPDVDIVFVTNTKYSEILKRKYKTYTLKRDTRAVIEKQYSYEEYLRYNTMAISKIIVHEKPDAVLFDCELNKELVLFCRTHLIKTVYVLRIPTAERFSAIKEDLTLFDLIIVPHEDNDFPAEQKEALLKRRAVFTGPIVDRCDYSADNARKNVLMTFGSGAGIPENFPFFSAADSFLKFLRENNSVIDGYPIHMDIVTGPFYEGGCDLSGFQVRSTSDSLVRDMYEAKAVISAAGYNTINEIVHTKTPAVVVPLSRRWDDQFQRADRLERLGCIRVARNSILDPLRDIFKNWQIYHDKFPCMRSGNQQAARVLSEVLGEKEK
jgi:predicted glycosyltransferase